MKLARLAVASLALVFIFSTSSVNAAPITEILSGTVSGGPFGGMEGSGSFSYDNDDITGTGSESITAGQSLTLDFAIFLGQTFTEANGVGFSARPELFFLDGAPVFLDFVVSEILGPVVTDIALDGVDTFGFINLVALSPDIGDGFEVGIFVNELSSVPEPGAALLIGFGVAGLAARRVVRRRG